MGASSFGHIPGPRTRLLPERCRRGPRPLPGLELSSPAAHKQGRGVSMWWHCCRQRGAHARPRLDGVEGALMMPAVTASPSVINQEQEGASREGPPAKSLR